MKVNLISRRNFIEKTALTTGAVSIFPIGLANNSCAQSTRHKGSLHDVWIAGVSQAGLSAKTPEEMVEKVLVVLKDVAICEPDFICLPELFPFWNLETKLPFHESVEVSDKILPRFAEFSRLNNCYTICPVFTSSEGRIYNSAVVFNRSGDKIGQYNKIHETVEYVRDGITCGAMFQPVIQTEFGPIGIQICYDLNWEDSWKMLRDQGAKIIFWPSQFDGGQHLNIKALLNRCIVVSSTTQSLSKMCDIDGSTIARTGSFDPNFFCGRVNMEKIFLQTSDFHKQTTEIRKKYGRKVKVTVFHDEDWTIVESLSPGLSIKDLEAEFNLTNHVQWLRDAETKQSKSRV